MSLLDHLLKVPIEETAIESTIGGSTGWKGQGRDYIEITSKTDNHTGIGITITIVVVGIEATTTTINMEEVVMTEVTKRETETVEISIVIGEEGIATTTFLPATPTTPRVRTTRVVEEEEEGSRVGVAMVVGGSRVPTATGVEAGQGEGGVGGTLLQALGIVSSDIWWCAMFFYFVVFLLQVVGRESASCISSSSSHTINSHRPCSTTTRSLVCITSLTPLPTHQPCTTMAPSYRWTRTLCRTTLGNKCEGFVWGRVT
jgi:hypothetical protein